MNRFAGDSNFGGNLVNQDFNRYQQETPSTEEKYQCSAITRNRAERSPPIPVWKANRGGGDNSNNVGGGGKNALASDPGLEDYRFL